MMSQRYDVPAVIWGAAANSSVSCCRFTGALSGFYHVFTLPCLLRLAGQRQSGKISLPSLILHLGIPLAGGVNLLAQFFVTDSWAAWEVHEFVYLNLTNLKTIFWVLVLGKVLFLKTIISNGKQPINSRTVKKLLSNKDLQVSVNQRLIQLGVILSFFLTSVVKIF